MKKKVSRPKASKKRINSNSEFELCYLRHRYLRQVNYNPTKEDMEPYMWIVRNCSKNTYNVYQVLFEQVGLALQDILSIAQVQLINFLGLFSIKKWSKRMGKFKANFQKTRGADATPNDVLQKNKADFTIFLKQRMEDLVRICRQKAKNIKGLFVEEYQVFAGPTQPIKNLEYLLDNYKKLGYRKVDISVFKSIKKKLKDKQEGPAYFINSEWYICVPLSKKNIELVDFSGAGLDPYDNMHHMNPEKVFFHKEEEEKSDRRIKTFNKYNNENKKKVIAEFILNNETNSLFEEEIKIARKMLKRLEN